MSIYFNHLGSLNAFLNDSLVNIIIKVITKVIFLLVYVRESIISIYNILLFNKVEYIIIISLFSLTNIHVLYWIEWNSWLTFVEPDMSTEHLIYK